MDKCVKCKKSMDKTQVTFECLPIICLDCHFNEKILCESCGISTTRISLIHDDSVNKLICSECFFD